MPGGGEGVGGDSRLSPTPKEKILQKFKSTNLEKPTKSKSTKLQKSTESKIPTTTFDGEKSNIARRGGGRLKLEPNPQRDYPAKYPT